MLTSSRRYRETAANERDAKQLPDFIWTSPRNQTVDVGGGIWKVRRWTEPKTESAIDPQALREELIRAAFAWSEANQDAALSLICIARPVRVKSLNRERVSGASHFPGSIVPALHEIARRTIG